MTGTGFRDQRQLIKVGKNVLAFHACPSFAFSLPTSRTYPRATRARPAMNLLTTTSVAASATVTPAAGNTPPRRSPPPPPPPRLAPLAPPASPVPESHFPNATGATILATALTALSTP